MTASPALIVIAVGAGAGAAFALYKAWWAKQQTPVNDACAGACGGDPTCLGLCNLAGGVATDVLDGIWDGIEWIFSDHTPLHAYSVERERRQGVNDKLNGAPAITNPYPIGAWSPLQSETLRYENGCEPFFDAPGWSACETGTQDMYSSAIDAASGKNFGLTEKTLISDVARTTPYSQDTTLAAPIDKNNFLTGLGGDPTTVGPFGNGIVLADPLGAIEQWVQITGNGIGSSTYEGDGNFGAGSLTGLDNLKLDHTYTQTAEEAAQGPYTWLSRGKRITCPDGQAPKSVVLAATGQINTDPTETCVDPNSAIAQCNGTAAPPGYTWSTAGGAGHWAKAQPGAPINNGPCAPQKTGGIENVAVGLGLANAQLGAHGL